MRTNRLVERRLMTAEEAAARLPVRGTIATSGFTTAQLELAPGKHTPHDLRHAFDWHTRYLETGSMKALATIAS